MKKLKTIALVLFLVLLVIYAKKVEAASFESAEWVEGVYRNKVKDGVVVSSRKERIMRDSETGEIAYCIEPYGSLINGYHYEEEYLEYSDELNITKEDYKRITLLAYYGYNYEKHTDPKWYSITQLLIWRTLDKTSEFYWVDSVNGKRIEPYSEEIKELERLIQNHTLLPNIPDLTKTKLTIKKEYSFEDINSVLSGFNIAKSNVDASILNNNMVIKSNTSGEKYIELERRSGKHDTLSKIYISNNSQNVIKIGNYNIDKTVITFEILSGSITITKIDKDTKDTNPNGSASLIGAIYELYDENNNLLKELIIQEDNKASAENLPFGNYSLKEIQSGKGYYLNKKIYTVTINENNQNIELKVENEVINSKLILHKYYGNNKKWYSEPNIIFHIYNEKGNLYKEFKTNKEGIIELILPYGKYKFVQLNTTDNYQPVNSFEITINELSSETISCDLYDIEIETPNTSTNKESTTTVYFYKRKEYE